MWYAGEMQGNRTKYIYIYKQKVRDNARYGTEKKGITTRGEVKGRRECVRCVGTDGME